MKILFICTHNRCRSILAEAITRHLADGRIEARSAGSEPAGDVHPLTLQCLNARQIPSQGLTSQSWDEYEHWQPDAVITVCDSAAGEQCPLWFGSSVKAHWGLPDPSRLANTPGQSEQAVDDAFLGVMNTLEKRIRFLLDHQLDALQGDALKQQLEQAGAL